MFWIQKGKLPVEDSEYFFTVECDVERDTIYVMDEMKSNVWNTQVFSCIITDILYELSKRGRFIFAAEKNIKEGFEWLQDGIQCGAFKGCHIISKSEKIDGKIQTLFLLSSESNKSIFATFIFCAETYQVGSSCRFYLMPREITNENGVKNIQNNKYFLFVEPAGDGHGIRIGLNSRKTLEIVQIVKDISEWYGADLKLTEVNI